MRGVRGMYMVGCRKGCWGWSVDFGFWEAEGWWEGEIRADLGFL